MGSILSSLFRRNTSPWNQFEEIPDADVRYLEGLKKKYPKDITIWDENLVNSCPEVIKKDLTTQGATPVMSVYYDPGKSINLFTIWYHPKDKLYVYRDGSENFGWGTRKNLREALKIILGQAEMFGFGSSVKIFSKKKTLKM